jgi:short-subunit dehydrogenase
MSFALITGASKGIGKSIAEHLAVKGYSLLLVARSEDLLQEVKQEIEAKANVEVKYLALDLSISTSAQQIFNWCCENDFPVSILVNNAGYGLSGAFESYPLEQHLNMIQVNCLTLVQLTHLFLPRLKQQNKGYILNIASSAAYQAVPYLSLYAASKSFVLQFSRGLHYELRKSNVSVTCLSPGATDTDFVKRAKIGSKGLKAADKVNMTPDEVAKIGVDSLFKKKTEVITGAINKIGGFLTWILPKKLVEGTTAKLYE